jgi:hypothetical protein
MESIPNKIKSTHISKKVKLVVPILAILLVVGSVSAAVITVFYTQSTATVKTPDIQLVAGPDGAGGTTFPSATVTVASTHDYANVAFSLFPSATNTPQPATYYTNLLQITNVGTASHTIKSITITSLSGATNLGNVTIYYYAAQTDSPTTGTPIGSTSLISSSTAPVTVFSGSQAIAASATNYIEIVGYAASTASAGSTIGFTVSINWA